MNTLTTIFGIAFIAIASIFPTSSEPEPTAIPEPIHTKYVTKGRYYTIGEVITDDGNTWIYDQETISDKPSYDAEPVYVAFDDNGTPDELTDDIILGLVWDIETAIYDKLEDNLSESFVLERENNTINLIGEKE